MPEASHHAGRRLILVVGASLAGVHAAQAARRAGWEGELVVIGDEPHRPYDRPPLSKEFLTGPYDEDRLLLRPTADPANLDFTLKLGRKAIELDVEQGRVMLDDGEVITYEGLVIATGAQPRRLPASAGAEGASGLHVLRSLDDARSLREDLHPGKRVLVVGAGFIGAEVAASARQMGCEVTLIDLASAPLDRVLDSASGMAIADLHRSNGVDVRLEVALDHVEVDEGGRVKRSVLSSGDVVAIDTVVVGIGVVPNTDWLSGSGLTVDDGVVADETCLAAPRVVVAGDVAKWPNRSFGGRMMRVEQWDNAIDQGGYAGRRIVAAIKGDALATPVEPYAPIPWFWSDQYDRKIQLAGMPTERAELMQGAVADRQFVKAFLDEDDVVQGVLCWNRPRQAVLGRQLVAAGESVAAARERLG